MKRRHLRDDAIRFCEEARRLRPDMTFGADIIAGFPTETEAQFANSLRLVEECHLTWLHVFPYSPRPGTPAARMPQVDGRAIKDRAARLRGPGRPVAAHLAEQQGRAHNILMEHPRMGRTEQFTEVAFDKRPRRGRDREGDRDRPYRHATDGGLSLSRPIAPCLAYAVYTLHPRCVRIASRLQHRRITPCNSSPRRFRHSCARCASC